MSKVSEMMMRREPQDIIEIGEIMNKFYLGYAGEIFRALVNTRIEEQITQVEDIKTSADRRLGRAEGIKILQIDIERTIQDMHEALRPIPQEEGNE